jgi:heat shock protein HtpX
MGSRRSSRKSDKGGGGALVIVLIVLWLIAVVLAPVLGRLLAMAVSRRREYLADASGAELTRNPLGLASALEKIDQAVEPTASVKQGTAHLCIADPIGRSWNNADGGWSNLMATHPPMLKRIAALKRMAFQRETAQ